MSLLADLSATTRRIAEVAGPAVVAVGRDRRGAGVVIAAGKILTNAHNLRDQSSQVTFADGRVVQATVAGADPGGDLVVLDADTGSIVPVAPATSTPDVGDVVFGAALGHNGLRVTHGFVSGTGRSFRGPRGRTVPGAIEHTAPLARGSSGGPLLDADGHLVGINTHRLFPGFYLARAVDDEVRARLADLSAGRSFAPPTLGVALAPAHVAAKLRRAVGLPERTGLLVRAVVDGSPAARAGVQQGDLLVQAGDRILATVDDLHVALDAGSDTLALVVVRGADELPLTVRFAPDQEPAA